jgi:hypothetical protein
MEEDPLNPPCNTLWLDGAGEAALLVELVAAAEDATSFMGAFASACGTGTGCKLRSEFETAFNAASRSGFPLVYEGTSVAGAETACWPWPAWAFAGGSALNVELAAAFATVFTAALAAVAAAVLAVVVAPTFAVVLATVSVTVFAAALSIAFETGLSETVAAAL